MIYMRASLIGQPPQVNHSPISNLIQEGEFIA